VKVVVHPADEGGCGHYRLIWPAEALAAEGRDVTVSFGTTYPFLTFDTMTGPRTVGIVGDRKAMNRIMAARNGEIALAKKRGATEAEQWRIHGRYVDEIEALCRETGRQAVDADVVVMQRILSRERFEMMRAFQAAGIAVVVEIDDDFHAIHPRNPGWRDTNPLHTDGTRERDWLARACEHADLVTVSTPALAERYGSHGRVAVLDNYVPSRYVGIEPGTYSADHFSPRPPSTALGWSGSVATHPGDLEVTQGAIGRVVRATGCRFEVVGTGNGVGAALDLPKVPEATGWVPIDAYPEALARIDVGIVPLKASAFNEAKSHLKGLEYAAVGVPFVATPTGPYRRLHAEGIGLLADTPDDWYDEVRRLVIDPGRREHLAITWAAKVADDWTVERNAWRWWDAWRSALDHSVRRESCATSA
jgi:hypothetical protein